jgi:hypothetical protein
MHRHGIRVTRRLEKFAQILEIVAKTVNKPENAKIPSSEPKYLHPTPS